MLTSRQLLSVVSAAGCIPDGLGFRYLDRAAFMRARVVALAACPDARTEACDSLGYPSRDGSCEGVFLPDCEWAVLVGPQLDLADLDGVTVSLTDAGISVTREKQSTPAPAATIEVFGAYARAEREAGR